MDFESSEKEAQRKDSNSSPPALDKEKDTEESSSEKDTADYQEKTADGTTLPSKQAQINSQQPQMQYVPPYGAIVRGLTADPLGNKNVPKDSKTNYRDFSKMADPIPDGRNRGGVAEVFPLKLHR